MLDPFFLNHLDPHIFKLPWMYFFFLHVLGLPFHVIESELLEPPYGRKFQELFGVHEVHRNFVKKRFPVETRKQFSGSCKKFQDFFLILAKNVILIFT
jgi:hypothetical protein